VRRPAGLAGQVVNLSESSRQPDRQEPLQPVEINGVPVDRIVFSGRLQGKTMLKHVACFHRQGRLYSFVGLYWQTDSTVRQQVERAVESILWE